MRFCFHGRPGRDDTVELWRFLFCIAVLGLHFFSKINSTIFRAGYLGVEFFFLLSGYGVFRFYTKKMARQTMADRLSALGTYIGRRIIRLYPLYFISLLLMLLLRIVQQNLSFGQIVSYLKLEWAELLWLQCGPLGNEVLISEHWYVPAMFWGSLFLLVILMVTGRFGGFFLCPVISMGIYGYYLRLIHKIDVIYSYHAVLRAIAGISLGIFIGFVVDFLQKKWEESTEKNKGIDRKPYFLYWIANLLLLTVLVYMNFGRRSFMDFVVIGVFAVAISFLLFLRRPVPDRASRVFAVLSSVSYPIYLFQMPVIELFFWLF